MGHTTCGGSIAKSRHRDSNIGCQGSDQTIMSNNVYKFGHEVKLQSEGGAIGVRATGDVAKAVMVNWDKKFNEKLESLLSKTLMYKRYVDDQNMVIESVKPGMRFDPSSNTMIQGDEEEDVRNKEERTMETVREIGDSISDMIQLTVDFPERNENGRVPILDLEVWIERDED